MAVERLIAGKDRRVGGWKREPPDPRDRLLSRRPGRGLVLSHTDLSVAPGVARVEDQSSFSSCVGNASTDAVEFLYIRDGLPQPELSRMMLYYDARVSVGGFDASDDSGCYIRDAMKALAKYGVATETIWPYVSANLSRAPSKTARRDAERRQIVEYVRCDGLRQIKESLAAGFPVVGGFDVFDSMFSREVGRTGVVPLPLPGEDSIGGHAILLIGNDDPTEFFKFKNSWGPNWGDRGFGYLPYAYVERGLADDFWSARMIEGSTVLPPKPDRRCWFARLFGGPR